MRWLHISDLHYTSYRGEDKEEEEKRKIEEDAYKTEELISSLKKFGKDYTANNPIDHMFFTGDLRDAPTQAPTKEAAEIIAKRLKEIADAFGISYENIHIVPGNHDCKRSIEMYGKGYDTKPSEFKKCIARDDWCKKKEMEDLKKIHKQYRNDEYRFEGKIDGKRCKEFLSERFDLFELVVNELGNKTWKNVSRPRKGSLHRLIFRGDFAFLLLNTAIAYGEGHKVGFCIGSEDISKELRKNRENKTIIAVGHHPIDYIRPDESREIAKEFDKHNVKLYLCGDDHVDRTKIVNNVLHITAGCLRAKRDKDSDKDGKGIYKGEERLFYIGEMTGDRIEIKAYESRNLQQKRLWQPPRRGHPNKNDNIACALNSVFKCIPDCIKSRNDTSKDANSDD